VFLTNYDIPMVFNDITITLKSNFGETITSTNIVVKVDDAEKTVTAGQITYKPKD
jgi:hypothetical protein